jgi:hypothetical protein
MGSGDIFAGATLGIFLLILALVIGMIWICRRIVLWYLRVH